MAWHHYRKACFDALVHCYIGIARACLLHKQGRSSKATDGGQFSTAKNAQLGHCKCDVNVCEPQNPPTYASGSRKSSIPYMLLCQQIPLHFQCLHPIQAYLTCSCVNKYHFISNFQCLHPIQAYLTCSCVNKYHFISNACIQ